MSGHSHWAGIKHKKGTTDQKRGLVFSKLAAAITAAVGKEPNPDFNPRLRTAVQKAKEAQVPVDNIARAIKRATESPESMEELLFEAYGPGGVAVLIEVVTDNRNRSVSEVKKVIGDHNGKWADPGSVQWAFEQLPLGGDESWKAKFPQPISEEDGAALAELVEALDDRADIQRVYTNAG